MKRWPLARPEISICYDICEESVKCTGYGVLGNLLILFQPTIIEGFIVCDVQCKSIVVNLFMICSAV